MLLLNIPNASRRAHSRQTQPQDRQLARCDRIGSQLPGPSLSFRKYKSALPFVLVFSHRDGIAYSLQKRDSANRVLNVSPPFPLSAEKPSQFLPPKPNVSSPENA